MERRMDPSLLEEPAGTASLTSAQVEERRRAGLDNRVKRRRYLAYVRIVLANLFSWFNVILFAVAIAFLCIGVGTSAESRYGITKYGFLLPVVINICIGIFQGVRAQRIIDRIALVSEPKVDAVRDGETVSVKVSDLVIGDLIILKQGLQVPIDGVLLSGILDLDESMLNGETAERRKSAGDELLAGSVVVAGEGQVRIRRVGNDTYAAKLKKEVGKTRKPKPEMVRAIDMFVLVLSVIIVPLAISAGVVSNRTLSPYIGGTTALFEDIAVNVGTIIVGAIPTGLVLLSSTRCAISAVALYRDKTSVKALSAVEGLALSQVLCIDKTGTLTTGVMEVEDVIYLSDRGQDRVDQLLSAVLSSVPDGSETARALRKKFTAKSDLVAAEIVPFNSRIKYSGCSFEGGSKLFYAIGSSQALIPEDSPAMDRVKQLASSGLRVMAFVERDTERGVTTPLALVCLREEIRPGAGKVIESLSQTGIAVKVISGDDPRTVSAVAARLGISGAERYLDCRDISEEVLTTSVDQYSIFGRTTPEQKRIIVRELQSQGKRVTMVIDALNDLLAARAADCSICISHEGGASAASDTADVTVTDGDFTHIPAILKEGRKTVGNVQRSATLFLMKSIMTIAVAVCCALFGHIPYSVEGLYLVTWFITGVGGFILGLEDTDAEVAPGFGKRVMSEALPAGLFLFLCIFSVQLMVMSGVIPYAVVQNHSGLSADELSPVIGGLSRGTWVTYSQYLEWLGEAVREGEEARDVLLSSLLFIEEPVCILAAVIGAFGVMIRCCLPLDKYRLTTIGICAVLVVLATLIFPMFFLGADNIPRGKTFWFVPFYSEGTYFAAIWHIPAASWFLVALAAVSIPLYAGFSYLSRRYVFKVTRERFRILEWVDFRTDHSLGTSIAHILK